MFRRNAYKPYAHMSSGEQKFYEKNKFLTRITKKLCDYERITKKSSAIFTCYTPS